MSNQNQNQNGIIAWFVNNPVAANLLLISIIILGFLSLNDLRKETFPSLEPSTISVSVNYNSGSPEQSEEGIAINIEDSLEGVDGIKRITSTSNANGSTISIEKSSGYDLDTLMLDVSDKIDAINNLPSDADRPIIQKAKRESHAIYVQLYGDTDREEFQKLAKWLKSDLLKRNEISNINIITEIDPFIYIEIDQYKLKAYSLTLSDIENSINSESNAAISTSLRNGDKTVKIKSINQLYNKDEFSNISIISKSSGSSVLLGDIAEIKNSFDEDDYVLTRYNGEKAITLEIVMGDSSDIMNISTAAKEVVSKWQEGNYLPDNVKVTTWLDGSDTITDRLSLLFKNAISGILMVFIVLAVFLNIQVAFWVAAGLPFIFFGTLFFMTGSFTDLTINQMTTFGFIMALGIVVDDAVVIGESIYDTRSKEGDTIAKTIEGAKKVAMPTVFGILTTVVSFWALSNIEGGLGQIFAQFGTVVTICLLLSMVESKLILPAHLAHINTHKKESKYNIFSYIQKWANNLFIFFNDKIYTPIIEFSLNSKTFIIVLFISIIIAVSSMPITGKIKISFFPSIPGDKVSASLDMYDDTSFNQTEKNLLILEIKANETDKELIKKYNSEKETEISDLFVSSSSDTSGSISVVFLNKPVYTAKEFSDLWSSKSTNLEGVKKINIRSERSMGDNFKIEIKSIDNDVVKSAGQEIRRYIENIDGVSGIEDNLSQVIPQYRIELNDQGRALGFTASSLSQELSKTFGGGKVQKFQTNNNEVTVSVRYPREDRQTLNDLLSANVTTKTGSKIPVKTVANIYSTYEETSLTRIDSQKAIYISASVDKTILSSNELVNRVKEDVLSQFEIKYPNLNVSFSGEAEEQAETLNSMELMAALAMIGIYALLAIPLKSYVQPLLIMTSIPFGVIGAIIGHWVTDLQLSLLSLFGILALSGVVVNDSLLLVSRFNELRDRGMEVKEAILLSCKSRLRAVLLTSFTTFAGLVPLLSETSRQSEFLKPAAASLGYGILFATLITLILIPVLLMIQENIKDNILVLKNKIKNNVKTIVDESNN